MSDSREAKPLMITATMLRWFNVCHRRVWLDAFGDAAKRDLTSPIRAFSLNEGVKHEREIHQATAPKAVTIVPKNWEDGVRLTRELIQDGAKSILGAYLEFPIRIPS